MLFDISVLKPFIWGFIDFYVRYGAILQPQTDFEFVPVGHYMCGTEELKGGLAV